MLKSGVLPRLPLRTFRSSDEPQTPVNNTVNMSSSIQTRKLGNNGPRIPALGLGLMGLSFGYGGVPSDEERFAVLDYALEIGATFWDSAE